MQVGEHRLAVPLDHARPDGEQIEVFARSVETAESAGKPWLAFFQGGPGAPSPRPFRPDGWVGFAAKHFRVLLLDSRGTGCSHVVTGESVARRGGPAEQAAYLRLFRADAIVNDAECFRRALQGDAPWWILGQSYGGFCAVHYLSRHPRSLAGALITGGLPPFISDCDEVYRRTYPRVVDRNRRYFERYPADQQRLDRIAAYLRANDVRLPCGDRLTVRRFQTLGLLLGMSDGFELLHYLVEQAFSGTGDLDYVFLRAFEESQQYDTHPIFSVLHEAAYCEGFASRWSADRLRADYPECDDSRATGFHFTGEMIYRWMFDEIGALQPLAAAADLLAEFAGWQPLYDPAQLAANEVPVAAAVYEEDMYVERELSLKTAAAIQGIEVWQTNEHLHNGLRAEGATVLGKLLSLLPAPA